MGTTRTAAELLDASMVGAGLLGGTANIIMQLARPEVGHGVAESTVDSGRLFLRPVKRTRTALAYLAVAAIGTDEERRLYRRAVDRSHAQVRSTDSSPVRYNAFEQDLQLWVAAGLYRGFADTLRMFVGELSEAEAEAFYQGCARLGTTLQLRPERWPADRAAFEEYWTGELEKLYIDDTVREHLDQIVRLRYLPRPLSVLFGPLHRFIATGYLPPAFREQMRLPWSPGRQRRFDRMIRATALFVRAVPRPVRRFPFNAVLWTCAVASAAADLWSSWLAPGRDHGHVTRLRSVHVIDQPEGRGDGPHADGSHDASSGAGTYAIGCQIDCRGASDRWDASSMRTSLRDEAEPAGFGLRTVTRDGVRTILFDRADDCTTMKLDIFRACYATRVAADGLTVDP